MLWSAARGHITRPGTLHGQSPGRHSDPPLEGSLCRLSCPAPLCLSKHSGQRESHSGAGAKTVRLPAGITVRLQPGIVFVFTPERFSRSPRNPVRLAPESAVGMKRNEIDF